METLPTKAKISGNFQFSLETIKTFENVKRFHKAKNPEVRIFKFEPCGIQSSQPIKLCAVK
jgi:hypothetical protein